MSYIDGRGPAQEYPIWLEAEDNLDQICKKMEIESGNSEKQLAVLWTPNSRSSTDYRRTLLSASIVKAKVINLRKATLTVNDLSYTGSEFQKVFLVLGDGIDPFSESCLILLYNTISRSTRKVFIFCKESHHKQIKSLLTFSDTDIIFDKLRQGDNIGEKSLSQLFLDRKEKLEAMKRLLVSRNSAHSQKIDTEICSQLQTTNLTLGSFLQRRIKYKTNHSKSSRKTALQLITEILRKIGNSYSKLKILVYC